MKNKKSSFGKEVVQRYCPYIEENVVMMVNCTEENKKFECVEKRRCLHAERSGCSCAGNINEA